MKLRATVEGLGIPAIVETGALAKDVLVTITGNKTVDIAEANEFVLGRLVVAPKDDDGEGTVETRFKELIEIKASGTVNAGDFVKSAALSSGENQAAVWVDGTDSVKRIFGVCWKGGTNGQTIEVLVF